MVAKCNCRTRQIDHEYHEIERCPLHAAAPQMLAALDLVVRWFDSVDQGPDIEGIMLKDAIRAAKKAIKQAKEN